MKKLLFLSLYSLTAITSSPSPVAQTGTTAAQLTSTDSQCDLKKTRETSCDKAVPKKLPFVPYPTIRVDQGPQGSTSLHFSPDGKTMYTIQEFLTDSSERTVSLWNRQRPTEKRIPTTAEMLAFYMIQTKIEQYIAKQSSLPSHPSFDVKVNESGDGYSVESHSS